MGRWHLSSFGILSVYEIPRRRKGSGKAGNDRFGSIG
jgi:hypothetical protein